MPKVKAIIFDLDGTLRDTQEILFTSIEESFKHFGIEPVSREALVPYIHHHSFVVEAFAPQISLTEFESFYEPIVQSHLGEVQLYKGSKIALETLSNLNVEMAVVTAAKSGARDLHNYGIDSYFSTVITPDQVSEHKPHPEGILLALNKLKLPAENAIYVGDLPTDIQASNSAGVCSVGVTWGLGSRESLERAGADYIIDTLEELFTVMRTIEEKG